MHKKWIIMAIIDCWTKYASTLNCQFKSVFGIVMKDYFVYFLHFQTFFDILSQHGITNFTLCLYCHSQIEFTQEFRDLFIRRLCFRQVFGMRLKQWNCLQKGKINLQSIWINPEYTQIVAFQKYFLNCLKTQIQKLIICINNVLIGIGILSHKCCVFCHQANSKFGLYILYIWLRMGLLHWTLRLAEFCLMLIK